MRTNTQITLWLCLSLAFGSTGCRAEKNSTSSDTDKLQGTWQLIYQQINGKKLPDEKMAEMFQGNMVFAGDKIHYTVQLQGFDFEFAYKLQRDEQPKAIDLEVIDTVDKKSIGQKFFGIYLFEDDTLNWTVESSCRFRQLKEIRIGAKSGADFGGQEFLED